MAAAPRTEIPYFIRVDEDEAATRPKSPKVKKAVAKKGGVSHKEGVFSPPVKLAKMVLGEDTLNQIRGKAISMHSNVIGSFVDTAETRFGNAVLKLMFDTADLNKDGTICEEELQVALNTLGFDWIQEKQVKGIFSRADKDENGAVDLDEWMSEAPKTLRTNLVKLAKKNGGDMGFLA